MDWNPNRYWTLTGYYKNTILKRHRSWAILPELSNHWFTLTPILHPKHEVDIPVRDKIQLLQISASYIDLTITNYLLTKPYSRENYNDYPPPQKKKQILVCKDVRYFQPIFFYFNLVFYISSSALLIRLFYGTQTMHSKHLLLKAMQYYRALDGGWR